jgi:hypothetical protein
MRTEDTGQVFTICNHMYLAVMSNYAVTVTDVTMTQIQDYGGYTFALQ